MVPLFDRNSGDLRLFSILKILSKSYQITYIARQLAHENDRYVSHLNGLGISVYFYNKSIKDMLNLFYFNKFKAAIIEFYDTAEHFLPMIKLLQPSCPVIVDTVDIHYLRFHRKYQMTKDVNDLLLSEKTKNRELTIYSKADITLTVTEEDGRIIKDDNQNITVRILPNVHQLVYPTGPINSNEIIFVGGFNHEPNIDAVLYFSLDILPRIRRVIPDVKLTIVGSNPPVQINNLSNDFIKVTGYVPSTTPYLQKSYISVAPIRYGAGMKGKIGEAMSHGLPVVTTSIGAEGMGLTNRENVMIADSPEDFSDAVLDLMNDNNLYEKIKDNAMEHIENNFTPEKIGNQIQNILVELKGMPVKKLSFTDKVHIIFKYALKFANKNLNIPVYSTYGTLFSIF